MKHFVLFIVSLFLWLCCSFHLVNAKEFLEMSRKKKHHTKAARTFLILGDAGSTGTRLGFYEKTGSTYAATPTKYLKAENVFTKINTDVTFHEARLGEALGDTDTLQNPSLASSRNVLWYATQIAAMITHFETLIPPTSASEQHIYELMIFSTAGSRVTLIKHDTIPTEFEAQFGARIKVLKPNVVGTPIVRVISGRLEGLLGYLATRNFFEANADQRFQSWKNGICGQDETQRDCLNSKMYYYEIGGASSQIAWGSSSSQCTAPQNDTLMPLVKNQIKQNQHRQSHFLQKNTRSLSKGYIDTNNLGGLPHNIFSKSFLGNGGEKSVGVIAEFVNPLCFKKPSSSDKLSCIKEVIRNNLVEGGYDMTAQINQAERKRGKYLRQWAVVRYYMVCPAEFNAPLPDQSVMIVNSKAIAGALIKDQSSLSDQQKQNYYRLFKNKEEFANELDRLMLIILESMDGSSASKKIGEDPFNKYRDQAIAISLQMEGILNFLQWKGKVVVINFGEWTDGVIWLFNNHVTPDQFDAFRVRGTNKAEDISFSLLHD